MCHSGTGDSARIERARDKAERGPVYARGFQRVKADDGQIELCGCERDEAVDEVGEVVSTGDTSVYVTYLAMAPAGWVYCYAFFGLRMTCLCMC